MTSIEYESCLPSADISGLHCDSLIGRVGKEVKNVHDR